MSVCICNECERLVDTDFEEGYWDNDDDFYCDNCADDLGFFDEEAARELRDDSQNPDIVTIGWQNLPPALRR